MITFPRKHKEKQIRWNIKQNPKAFWKYTSSKTKTSSTISSLHMNPNGTDSVTVDNSMVNANILNDYFASVFTKEPNGDFCELEHRDIDEQSQIHIRKLEVKKLQKEKQISGNIKQNPKPFWKYTSSKTKTSLTISSLHMNPNTTKNNEIN